jgi:DNA-binding NarL/FixJ family response regulator
MLTAFELPGSRLDAAGIAHRRRPALMVIVDRNLRTIAQSFNLDISELDVRIRRLIERHIAERGSATHATVEVLDAETALRVTDLAGDGGELFAVTFEQCAHTRDAIEEVATEHHLTSREREVFRMLLGGATDNDVSERLSIARTTAADHAKNILRKTGANKRTELFARVITYSGRVR